MTGKEIVPYDPVKYERNRQRVESDFWPKVRRSLGKVPFVEDAVAAYYCAMDRETPTYVKATLMTALAYFVVPTDLLPDVVAAFGYTDDATVVALAINAVAPHVKEQHRESARAFLQSAGTESGSGETA
ncbi:MAG: YkvA family protein [Kiloniellales bacterium]|nr:YkvA family protein [Kiloniellales bacterium]